MRTATTAIALLALLLAACARPAEESSRTSNSEIEVERLFTHDGCAVYRFHDYGNPRYFARCGESASVSHREGCGKGCTREVNVRTEHSR